TLLRILPPEIPIYFAIILLSHRPHVSLYDGEWLRVFSGLVFGHRAKVDDPATGGAVRTGVEVLANEVGEQHVPVARILLDEGLCLLGFQDEPLTKDNRPLERLVLVRHQPPRLPPLPLLFLLLLHP